MSSKFLANFCRNGTLESAGAGRARAAKPCNRAKRAPKSREKRAKSGAGEGQDNGRKSRQHVGAQTGDDSDADLEHEFRISWHPDRVRTAERQCQPHLPDPWGRGERAGDPVDRRADDRPHHPADHRPYVGQDLGQVRAASPLFPRRRDPCQPGAVRDAQFARAVGCCGHAVDHGCLAQHHDGAVPGLCRRQSARSAANARIRDAEFLHRYRSGDRRRAPVCNDQLDRSFQHRAGRPDSSDCAMGVLYWRRCLACGGAVDRFAHQGIQPRPDRRVRAGPQ